VHPAGPAPTTTASASTSAAISRLLRVGEPEERQLLREIVLELAAGLDPHLRGQGTTRPRFTSMMPTFHQSWRNLLIAGFDGKIFGGTSGFIG